jgi:hypothetical protein
MQPQRELMLRGKCLWDAQVLNRQLLYKAINSKAAVVYVVGDENEDQLRQSRPMWPFSRLCFVGPVLIASGLVRCTVALSVSDREPSAKQWKQRLICCFSETSDRHGPSSR